MTSTTQQQQTLAGQQGSLLKSEYMIFQQRTHGFTSVQQLNLETTVNTQTARTSRQQTFAVLTVRRHCLAVLLMACVTWKKENK